MIIGPVVAILLLLLSATTTLVRARKTVLEEYALRIMSLSQLSGRKLCH
jgi:hypothetical protein